MSNFVPTLQDVQRSQLTRLDIVHLLTDPQIEEIIQGCFVRVLLEIETGHEDYRIFTIKSVGRGVPYHGFSSDQTASTDLYIDLNLPQDLRGINGIAFQLNSVSNSRITQAEYNVWVQSPGPQPSETEAALQHRLRTLASHPTIGPRRPNIVAVPDIISPDAALRAVMEELRETYSVFVNPEYEGPAAHKTALLRTAERDLADYLDKLREVINSQRQTCVVCMDRPPTVVTLPCKHKVLCRLCASQVNNCPCCRETAVEVFEPIEP